MRIKWRLSDGSGQGVVEVSEPVDLDALMAMLMVETGKDNIILKHSSGDVTNLKPNDTVYVYSRPAMRMVEMPDDNSCLFHAFSHLIPLSARQVRQAVAQLVFTVDEVILGRPKAEYAAWIQSDNSWGGAIEIMLLSQHFDLCIRVIDVQHLRIDEFNQPGSKIAYLLYSGIHYDLISGVYSHHEDWHREEAMRIAQIAKLQHRYTDLTHLRCDQCGLQLNGQVAAQRHAQSTGHQSFSEK